ncbi:MAG: VanZ family protein [Phycisphaerae bacterium]|nr:VanZ family protein [Phycisphaerae bacterium]
MKATRPLMYESAWTHWYRRALPAYWIFVFCATHFPNLQFGGGIPSSDKLAHALAFALLAFLFWRFAETFRRPLSGRFVWVAGIGLGLYAAFDEYTQRFVGRGVDVRDWLCGMAGIALALGLLEWRRRKLAARR